MTKCRHCGEPIVREYRSYHRHGADWIHKRSEDESDHHAEPAEEEGEMNGDGYLILPEAGGMVIAPNWEAVAGLHRKISAVMGAIDTVVKDKRNTFHNYDYASNDAVSDAVSKAMADAGLAVSVTIANLTQVPAGKGTHVLVELAATFMDGETGAMKVLRWYGEASDTGDKGVAKACTSGLKFLLARNLLISTGDADPDAEKGEPPTTSKTTKRTKKRATELVGNGKPEAGEGWNSWSEADHRHYFAKAGQYQLTDAIQYAIFGVKSRKEIILPLAKVLPLLELVGKAVMERALPFGAVCDAWEVEYPAQVIGSGLTPSELVARLQKKEAELLAPAEQEIDESKLPHGLKGEHAIEHQNMQENF